MDLTFKALQDDFTGVWPAKLYIENPEYKGILFYAGATADPSGDVGEYAADLAAGRLSRRNLSLKCKPKSPKRGITLNISRGHLRLALPPLLPDLTLEEAPRFVEDLLAAIDSAAALEEFIAARFGPDNW